MTRKKRPNFQDGFDATAVGIVGLYLSRCTLDASVAPVPGAKQRGQLSGRLLRNTDLVHWHPQWAKEHGTNSHILMRGDCMEGSGGHAEGTHTPPTPAGPTQ